MLFATTDFGAGGAVMLILCGIGLLVLAISGVAIARGVILIRRPGPNRSWLGLMFILAGVLLPIFCFSAPSVLFRQNHDTPPLGHYPNGVIREGMSPDDVRALLGNPHQVNNSDPQRVTWLYWLDAFELGWFVVIFDAGGKVIHTGGD